MMRTFVCCSVVILLFWFIGCRGPKDQGAKILDPMPKISETISCGSGGDDQGKDPSALRIDEIEEGSSQLEAIFFDYDKSDIRSDQIQTLQANARILRQQELDKVQIEGHCDERGTEEYNLALGDRRARMVKEYLNSLGISPDRLNTISYGEARPFEREHDEGAWHENRRAHFVKEDQN